MKHPELRRRCLAVLAGAAWAATLPAHAANGEAERAAATVSKALLAFEDLVGTQGQEGLRSGLKTARGILIFPAVIKGGVVLGGSGGTGVLLVRGDDNSWSSPAFYTLGAVSIGLQIGGQSAEVVILATSRKAVDSLMSNSAKLGGDISVAVGPVGVGKASNIAADFVAYTRSKGAFLGASIEGSVLDVRDSLNQAYYGQKVTPADIVLRGSVSNPQAQALRKAVADAAQ